MKVRKLAVALALAGGLGSGVAQALGLGEVELQSYLNEPLDADIRLLKTQGVSPDEIFVELASRQSYERLGITRDFFLTNLNFEVVTAPNGGLMVNVSSREPVREPYLNFLLEITWPSGRLMREYAVLVDPPVYAEDSGLTEQVQAPTTSPQRSESTRQITAPTQQPQQRAQSTTARTTSGNTFGPTGPSDTLWGIAAAVRPGDDISQQQVMLALQDLNPDAFIDSNINKLKQGEVLRIPNSEQMRVRTRSEAIQQVTVQNEALTRPKRSVDATASPQTAMAGAAPSEGAAGDELRLVVPESDTRAAGAGGSAGGDGRVGGVDAGDAAAMEQLDQTRRANEELTTRVDDLQDQVQTLQRLIELKNSQLADLQTQAQVDDAEPPMPESGQSTVAAEPETSDESEAVTGDVAADSTESAGSESSPATATAEDASSDGMASADGEGTPVADSAETEETMDAAASEAEPDESMTAPVSDQQQAASQSGSTAPEPEKAIQGKGFPGNVIDAISNNILYQIALGGGLVLLLLLLLMLARRNANREKAFYEQLNNESADDSDGFDLTLDDRDSDAEAGASDTDPMADAVAYIAYGRLDQAAQTLESAISREPSRTDLRLKLLGVYADSQDRSAFEKQYSELEALDDEDALAEASSLRMRLEEAESMPSIDDLESQLRSDSFNASGEYEQPEDEASASVETATETSASGDDFDNEFEDFTLDDEDLVSSTDEAPFAVKEDEPEASESDKPIEFDLSGLELENDDEIKTSTVEGSASDDDDDISLDFEVSEADLEEESDAGLELGLETSDEDDDFVSLLDSETLESEPSGEGDTDSLDLESEFESLGLDDNDSLTEDELDDELPSVDDEVTTTKEGALDESFLDELDAELEKVAGEEEGDNEALDSDETLDDLELDVSDEDLALMEEVADSEVKGDLPSLNDELETEGASDDLDKLMAEDSDLNEGNSDLSEAPVVEPEKDVSKADGAGSVASKSAKKDIDESELGDDEDFDFLAGTDEAATKLDLARAYIEMGDNDGAKDILEEVSIEGDNDQKVEAQDLLKTL
ncbi:FimV/HubP family polar landmark protein [Marinobacter caseinilyticus]|uniref:FimV/HubP family polar landmark protein n=1 Tax=Marinobacter caseinilyticus TaxID=2692195 RepID=UPI00140BD2F6|nr:FimV/HubP family polar landmark protein [Marinobacter caseinilyticus]